MGEGKEMKLEAAFYIALGTMLSGLFHGNILMNIYLILYIISPIALITFVLYFGMHVIQRIEDRESKEWGRE
jgi:hypothetical protein